MTNRSCLFVECVGEACKPLFMEAQRVTVGSIAKSGFGGVKDANVFYFFIFGFFQLQVVLLTK